MAEFTRLKDGTPILRPVNVPSGAEGHESMAEVFGKVGRAVAETAVEIRNEQSNASLYQASNQIYRIKNESHELLLQHPDQTSKITEDSLNNINMVISNTPMNSADKRKLEYMANNDMTDIKIQGVKIGSDHIRTQAKISFATQWPEKIHQIQQSWSDPKLAEYQTDNARKAVSDAMASGLITPQQGLSYFDTLKETFEGAQRAYELYNSEDKHNARNLHKAIGPHGKPNSFHQMGVPMEESTSYLYSHGVKQYNFHDVMVAVYNNENIDMDRFTNLSKNEQEQIVVANDVRNSINSAINSGASWEELEKREEYLNSKNDGMLTTAQRTEKTYLKQWKEGFTKDKFLSMMGHTVLGSKASYDHQMAINAIQSNPSYDESTKQILIRDYDNQFIDKMVSAGESYQIPPDRIMPISSPEIMIAQGAFKEGGNPLDLLNTVDHYNKRNRVYVASAMKTPVQKEIAYTAGLLEGHTSNEMRATLIAANQPGIDFGVLKGKEKGEEYISPSIIQMKVLSNPDIKKITGYISKFKSKSNEARNAAMVDMTTNAVMYQGIKNNDLKLEKHEKYIEELGNEYAKGYDIYSGNDYAFNRKQQPQISDYEWAALSEYAKMKGHENLKRMKPDASEVDRRQVNDINPLYMTITPDNRIVAQDQYGNPVFSQIFDNSLLTHAIKEVRMSRMSIEEKIARKDENKTLSANQMLKSYFR
jgi:hypothetical protein